MENKSLSKSLRKKPKIDTKSLRICKSTNSKRHMTNDGEKNSKVLKKNTTSTEKIPELSSALPQDDISSDSFPRSPVKQSNDFEGNKASLNSNMKTENVQALTEENSPVTKENIIQDENQPSCSGTGRLSNFENLKSLFSSNPRHNKISTFGSLVLQADNNGKDLNNPFPQNESKSCEQNEQPSCSGTGCLSNFENLKSLFSSNPRHNKLSTFGSLVLQADNDGKDLPQNESKSGKNINSLLFGNMAFEHSSPLNSNVKIENAQALTEKSSPISNKIMISGENQSFCGSTSRLPNFKSFKSLFSTSPAHNKLVTFKHSVPQADNNGKDLNNIHPQEELKSSKNINTIFSGNTSQKLETNFVELYSKLAPSASIVPSEHSPSSNSTKLREKEPSVKGGFENNAPIVGQDISTDQVNNEKSMIKTENTDKAIQGNASFSFTQGVAGASNLNKTSETLNLQRSDLHSANNQLEMLSSFVISHLKQLPLENSLFCQKMMLETIIEERLKVLENEKTTGQNLCGKNKKNFLLVNKLRLALLQLKDV